VQRILNVLAWIGTALVFGAAAVRILGFTDSLTVSANVDRYAMYASWAGLALVVLYTLAQWRSIVEWFGGRNARYGTLAGVSVIVALGILVARSVMSGRWRNIGMVWAGALLIASYVLGYFTPYIYSSRAVCVIPAGA